MTDRNRERIYWTAVSADLWRDEKVLHDLGDDGKLVWLYLLTGHHMTNFPLAFSTTLESLISLSNISSKSFKAGMKEVIKAGMARVDWRRRVVLLPNALRHRNDVVAQNLSSKVVKGWIAKLHLLPACELKNEAVSLTHCAALTGRPQVQKQNEGVWFSQAVEVLERMAGGVSHTVSEPLPKGYGSSLHSTLGRKEIGRAGRTEKRPKLISIPPAPQSPPGLSGAALGFLADWNALRQKLAQSTADAAQLEQGSCAELERLVAQAQLQRPDAVAPVLAQLCANFLQDKTVKVPQLNTLLNPRAWSWRLDEACREVSHADGLVKSAAEEIPDTFAGDVWRALLEQLGREGVAYGLQRLQQLRVQDVDGDCLVLECPDGFFLDWVGENYGELLNATMAAMDAKLQEGVTRVRFEQRAEQAAER